MNGFKDTDFNAGLASKMLDNIISKVFHCCELMIEDCKNKGVTLKNHEEHIQNYLLNNYLNNNEIRRELEFEKFLFESEVPENYISNTPIGRVDLKIISSDTFYNTGKYFIIECKRIDGSKKLNREYVKNGIGRFVAGSSQKYSSFYKRNCMLGFIVKELNISENTKKISQLHSEYSLNIKVKDPMHAQDKFPNRYLSSYWVDKNIIHLHHLFYDFSDIIN